MSDPDPYEGQAAERRYNTVDAAPLFAEARDAFARLAEKEAAFRASMMPDIQKQPQQTPCESHPDTMRPLDMDATCNEARATRHVRAIYKTCPKCAAMTEEAKCRSYWLRRGVEERNIEAIFPFWKCEGEFAEQKRAAKKAVREWLLRNGNFLLLIGSKGAGKGFLATAALKWHGSGIFVKHPDMLAELRNSYDAGGTEDLIRRWQDAEMLVLDEVGVSPGGKDEEPLLYRVLEDRYDKRRPTIITTNKTVAELREFLGYRITDRIQHDCVTVVCNWPSFRTGSA